MKQCPLLVSLLLISCATPRTSAGAPKLNPVQRATRALAEVRGYSGTIIQSVKLSAIMPPGAAAKTTGMRTRVTTKIAAALPDRMRIETSMDQPGMSASASSLALTGIYDSAWLWVIVKPPKIFTDARTQIIKVSGPLGARFDYGYNFRGTGLYPGRDLVGTAQSILNSYDFAAEVTKEMVGADSCIRLRGSRTAEATVADFVKNSPEQLAGIMRTRRTNNDAVPAHIKTMMDMLTQNLRLTLEVDLWLAESDSLPRKWAFRGGDTEGVTVVLQNIDYVNIPPAQQFVMPSELAKQATDITVQITEALATTAPFLQDAKAVEALKQEIVTALERDPK